MTVVVSSQIITIIFNFSNKKQEESNVYFVFVTKSIHNNDIIVNCFIYVTRELTWTYLPDRHWYSSTKGINGVDVAVNCAAEIIYLFQ